MSNIKTELQYRIALGILGQMCSAGLVNGQEAETIRRLGGEAQVVFITTSREHAIEAFGLGAVHYLLKPIEQAAVWEAMDRCLSRLGANAGPVLQIQTSHGSIPVSAA